MGSIYNEKGLFDVARKPPITSKKLTKSQQHARYGDFISKKEPLVRIRVKAIKGATKSERDVKAEIYAWLKSQDLYYKSKIENTVAGTLRNERGDRVRVGEDGKSDGLYLLGGKAYRIEIKSPQGGYWEVNQQQYKIECENRGEIYLLFQTLEEAKEYFLPIYKNLSPEYKNHGVADFDNDPEFKVSSNG